MTTKPKIKQTSSAHSECVQLKTLVKDFIRIANNKNSSRKQQLEVLSEMTKLFFVLVQSHDVKTGDIDDTLNPYMTPWGATSQALKQMLDLSKQLHKHIQNKDKYMIFVVLDNFKENLYFVAHAYNVKVSQLLGK